MSGLKDDRGRGAGIALAALLVTVGVAGVIYELRGTPPTPVAAPAANTPAPATPAAQAPATPASGAPAADQDSCNFPGPRPDIPNGDAATPEDMKTQHDAIQGFVHALEAYQNCENDKIKPDTDEATKQRLIALGNRAVDLAHGLANAYAVQLKAYHEKHPEPLPEK